MRKAPRHPFVFEVKSNDGEKKSLVAWAKVKQPRKPVEIVLTAEDVRESIKLKGVGNTQTCSMAICALKHRDAFAHKVVGYIDWQYHTCYVASRLDPKTRLPVECYRYTHNDSIARLNDTEGGQRELLAELEREGDRIIRLLPRTRRGKQKREGSGGRDGSRSGRAGVGAKLRHAVATLGGLP